MRDGQTLGCIPLAHPEIEILGEASGIDSALRAISEYRPDLLFLDIQMPGGSGFDLIARLPLPLPQIIFTTAYDLHALRAFEVNAIDYLLKPVDSRRLATAISRLAGNNTSGAARSVPFLLDDRVFLRSDERTWFIRISSIRLLESETNHTRIHFGSEQPLIHRCLAALETRLPVDAFMRANRTQIINLHAIESITPWFSGSLKVGLTGGETIEFSRRQARLLRELRGL